MLKDIVREWQITAAALLAISASACTIPQSDTPAPPPDSVELAIAGAVVETARVNREVSQIEKRHAALFETQNGNAPEFAAGDASSIPPRHLSIEWNGPIEELLLTMARFTETELQVTGRPVAPSALVSISFSEEPLPSAIEKIDKIAFGMASVDFNPSEGIIMLRYPP